MTTDNSYWGNPQGQPTQPSQPAQLQSQLYGVEQSFAHNDGVQQPQVQQPQAQAQGQLQAQQAQLQVQPQPQQPQPQAQAQQAQVQQPQLQAQTQQAQAQQSQPQPQQPQPQAQAKQAQTRDQAYQYAPGFAYAGQAPYYQPTQVIQKKSHGWIVAIVIVACLFLLSVFGIKSCTDSMASLSSFGMANGSSQTALLNEDAIAIIDIDGTIQYDGSACSPEGLKALLDEAEDNSHIKGVVLRVNSGGGTATAGEEMAEYVRAFSKPVVVSSAAINASAAYEISSQADYIFVAKSTEIGAIGTAMELMDLSGLFEMLGINMDTIVSAEQKDSSYGYRSLTDEERAYYQAMVNDINEVFVNNVAEGRKMSVDDVRQLATGMPFTGVTSVENGLADEIGTREDAIDKCAELAGITSYTTIDLSFTDYGLSDLAYLLGEGSSDTEGKLKIADVLGARVR